MQDVKNRRRFLKKIGLEIENIITPVQVHKADIKIVTKADGGTRPEVDGLITKEPGVILTVLTADCIPLMLTGEDKIGLIHVSRHNVGEIVQKARFLMGKNLKAMIGPSIYKESFVFELRRELDKSWDQFLTKVGDKYQVDLVGRTMFELGEMQVEVSNVDTAKDVKYFSHYRSMRTGEEDGRFMTVVGMV